MIDRTERLSRMAPHSTRGALRLLAAAAACCALLSFGSPAAEARTAPRSGINVDVSPLLNQGLGSFAEGLRAELAAALQDEFAGKLAPGQRVLVQLRGLSLNSYVGDERGLFGTNDYLDGVVTLVGPDGREIASRKILTVLPASSGGAWYIAGNEQRRAAGLARAFASWARRYMVG